MNIGFVDLSWDSVVMLSLTGLASRYTKSLFRPFSRELSDSSMKICTIAEFQEDFAPKETVEGLVIRPASWLSNLPLQPTL